MEGNGRDRYWSLRVCAGFVNGLTFFFFHVYFALRNFIFLCSLIGVWSSFGYGYGVNFFLTCVG